MKRAVKILAPLLGPLMGLVMLASPAQATDEGELPERGEYLPSYTKPRPGYPDQVIAFGYQACQAMDHHPDDLEAAVAEAYPNGQARSPGEPYPRISMRICSWRRQLPICALSTRRCGGTTDGSINRLAGGNDHAPRGAQNERGASGDPGSSSSQPTNPSLKGNTS